MVFKKVESDLERFSKKYSIDELTGCWNWIGAITKIGYGQFSIKTNKKNTLLAHRVSYTLHIGIIPKGMCILHNCDNRKCVNPEHLRLGTNKDNTTDMFLKGREHDRKGINNNSKLDEKAIKEIRNFPRARGYQNRLKNIYNISQANISRIIRNEIWTHIQ
jgi:hypothetical protein